MDNKYILKTLDNGMKILLIPIPKTKLIDLQLAFSIGQDNETYSKTKECNIEAAHFLEHMFSMYTSSKYPSAKKINYILSQNGISNDATVDSNITKYDLKLHKKHLNFVLDMVYNTYKDFKLDMNIYEQEKSSVQEELKSILDDIWIDLQEKMNKAIYLNHTRGLSQRENLKNVSKMKPKQLMDFYNKYYKPVNTTLIIAGDFNLKSTMEQCVKLFGRIKDGGCMPLVKGIENIKKEPQIVFSKITKSMSYNLYINFRIPYIYFDEEYYFNYALGNILAKDLESILLKELRTKHGLIYTLDYDVNLDETNKSFSFLSINTQLDEKNLLKTIKIIFEILSNLKKKEIDKKEVKKYKTDIEMAMLEDNVCKDSEEFINLYGRCVIYNKNIESSKNMYKKLSQISIKELKHGANLIYKKENLILAYGGKNNYDNKIKRLIEQCGL